MFRFLGEALQIDGCLMLTLKPSTFQFRATDLSRVLQLLREQASRDLYTDGRLIHLCEFGSYIQVTMRIKAVLVFLNVLLGTGQYQLTEHAMSNVRFIATCLGRARDCKVRL